jgi:hypothetical protein
MEEQGRISRWFLQGVLKKTGEHDPTGKGMAKIGSYCTSKTYFCFLLTNFLLEVSWNWCSCHISKPTMRWGDLPSTNGWVREERSV